MCNPKLSPSLPLTSQLQSDHESDALCVLFKDAEFVSETVVINRLYHRELIARMNDIEDLEKKWNCKIEFPPTETASDVVTVSGPEYQVPQAVDQFLVG